MDLNPMRRRREREIAQDVAQEFMRTVTSTENLAPPELLAHHFGLVCQRLDFIPSEAEAKRILQYVADDIARKQRKADRLLRSLHG